MHKRHALSLWASTKACMRREVTLIYRHSFVYLFRLLQVGTLVSPFCNQSALSWRTAACIVYIRVLKNWVDTKTLNT